MRVGAFALSEVTADGGRLTAGFHLSEDQVAVARLRRLADRCEPLRDLCLPVRGIFRGPIFRRVFVDDPARGEPYVSSSDLMQAHVEPAGYLSRKHHGALLDELRLHEGMILLTCSGMNLGSAIWTRRDMDGLCATHDLIRIQPDPERVPPGYLYAFLAGRYGHAWIRKQIYGGSIKHVEPEQVAGMPVPQLSDSVMDSVAAMINLAMRNRSDAREEMARSQEELVASLGMKSVRFTDLDIAQSGFSVRSSELARLDAFHYAPVGRSAARVLASCCPASEVVGAVARVFTPGMFKRQRVGDEKVGFRYYSGSELFQTRPQHRGFLSRRSPGIGEYIVSTNWLLIQDAGQVGGLIGSVVRVSPIVDGGAVSNHLIRIAPGTPEDAGYLASLLASPVGRQAVIRHAFGSSIPQLDPSCIAELAVPWPSPAVRRRVAGPILAAWELQDSADALELKAIRVVEDGIEGVS